MDVICYYRVSTQRQGRSGLGLEAQQHSVQNFISQRGLTVVGEYTEIESGKNVEREELRQALVQCQRLGATLLIAKLDRLSRNVSFISALMDSGAEFIAVDMPEANKFIIHILAAVAEHEREMISQRTKEALAAAKARGVKLGNPNPKGATAAAHKAIKIRADKFAGTMINHIKCARADGVESLRATARYFNERHIPTARGKCWTPTAVKNLLGRLEI